jgi:hypothetical protein
VPRRLVPCRPSRNAWRHGVGMGGVLEVLKLATSAPALRWGHLSAAQVGKLAQPRPD